MATTKTFVGNVLGEPFQVTAVDLTTIAPSETLTVSHNGPSGASPSFVTYETQVEATSGDPVVDVERIVANDDLSNDTSELRVKTIPGGDLTGATVRVFFWFVPVGGRTNGVDTNAP
jgi:hypothetical protein